MRQRRTILRHGKIVPPHRTIISRGRRIISRRAIIDQVQIRFMHERGGLESVILTFAPQVSARHSAQLVINEGHQLRGRIRVVSTLLIQQERGDVLR